MNGMTMLLEALLMSDEEREAKSREIEKKIDTKKITITKSQVMKAGATALSKDKLFDDLMKDDPVIITMIAARYTRLLADELFGEESEEDD